jgi:hypothetical protein
MTNSKETLIERVGVVEVKVRFLVEQAMKAQRGSRGIALLFLTSALDGDVWSTPRPGRFTPGNNPVQEAGWAPGPVWMGAEYLAPHRVSILGPSFP